MSYVVFFILYQLVTSEKKLYRQGIPWSLKVVEFKCCKIKAVKALENEGGS